MNFLLSDSWLRDFIKSKYKPAELAKALTLHSLSVEHVLPEVSLLSDKIVLGEILEVKAHPNADKLKLAVVSTGKEKHNVVCGAPNIKPGMKIAFAKLGAVVKWHGEGEPVELKEAKIRGEASFGMICDDVEIGLAKYSNPAGVTDYSAVKAKPGTPLAQALKLDDTIYDIEVTVNRVDAASVVGMARELSAITGEKLNYQEKTDLKKIKPQGKALPLRVEVKDKEKCLGIHAVVLDGVKVGPSPEWLQRRLRAAGHSSFNNVVDITNYVMRELGHPLHAFDYQAIKGGNLIVRAAKKGEQLKTLDERLENLEPFMVVLGDKERAHSLGGVMGGYDSRITEQTTTVLLEAATWNPQTIRKTMMKLDKFSDAGGYFAKSVSPQLAPLALQRAVELIKEVTGARVASAVVSVAAKIYKPKALSMRLSQAELYIGTKIAPATIKKQLSALGFTKIVVKGDKLTCLAPHWRQFDMAIEEDLIEEVARLYGYHNIANQLPSGELPRASTQLALVWEGKIKTAMQGAGFTETYTYSLVSEKLSAGAKDPIKLLNPLDDEHVYLRTRLLPSVLEVAALNQNQAAAINLFEIANVYLPQEASEFAAVLLGKDLEATFRRGKGVALHVLHQLGLKDESLAKVQVVDANLAKLVGLKKAAVSVEISLQALFARSQTKLSYQEPAKFPALEFDLSIVVNNQITWLSVQEAVQQAGGQYLQSVELFDIYQQKDGHKSLAFHLVFRAADKTLQAQEIEPVYQKIINNLQKELKAQLRK